MARKPKQTYDQALASLDLNPKQLKAFEEMIQVARDALQEIQDSEKRHTTNIAELRGQVQAYEDQLGNVESLKNRNRGLADFIEDIGLNEREVIAMSLGARNAIRDSIHTLNVKLYYKDE